jgi:hypothetical protein
MMSWAAVSVALAQTKTASSAAEKKKEGRRRELRIFKALL